VQPRFQGEKSVSEEKAKQIAELNDRFRADFYIPRFGPRAVPGRIVCTRRVAALAPETQIRIWAKVANCDTFTVGNDPHGEHDFGAFDIEGADDTIFWKIDYYADETCASGSEDPADTARTFRILTIMLASEW
jgi:hypothetical protein